jgi:hypothetical protein
VPSFAATKPEKSVDAADDDAGTDGDTEDEPEEDKAKNEKSSDWVQVGFLSLFSYISSIFFSVFKYSIINLPFYDHYKPRQYKAQRINI